MEDGKESKESKQVVVKRHRRPKGMKSILDFPPEEFKKADLEINCGPTKAQEVLASHGLGPDTWARLLREQVEATKVKVFMDKDGNIIKSEEFVDHKTRTTARQDLGEILGFKPPQQIEAKVQSVKFIIED